VKKHWFLKALGISIAFVFAFYLLLPAPVTTRHVARRVVCRTNLSELVKAILIYSSGNEGEYPDPSIWCDLLIENTDITAEQFRCYGTKERCSYAMNPNCEPDSPNDVVLVFETKGGWNQFGGAELLTTENHQGKGCSVLFNDAHVEFVKSEEIGHLNWGDKQGNR